MGFGRPLRRPPNNLCRKPSAVGDLDNAVGEWVMQAFGKSARSILDRLYFGSGVVAALFLDRHPFALIVIQMLARWTGEVFSGRAGLRRILHGGRFILCLCPCT